VARDGDGWEGTVGVAEHLGSDTFVYVDVPQIGTMTARTVGEMGIKVGDRIRLRPDERRIHRFDTEGRTVAA
jgi:multiple sugar transport system ATP-binding protein